MNDKNTRGHMLSRKKLKNYKYNNLNNESDEFQKYHFPALTGEEFKLGRSNSSANTTSHSALSSSEALS